MSPKRHTNGQHVYEKCSASLIIREIKSKTTTGYHLTPVRMTIIKITEKNKCCQGCGEERTLCPVGKNVNGCSHHGNDAVAPQIKIKLSFFKINSHLRIFSPH